MGLIYSNARFLLAAKADGCSFESSVTLGRQQTGMTRTDFAALQTEFPKEGEDINEVARLDEAYADQFFHRCLGCKNLDAIDYSNYQNAGIVHDLNLPIDSSLHKKFDAVVDCGTIEHIFNVPVALRNCMQMVRVGGHLMITTTANNHCGHGFYQFSPELFFRLFQSVNGFEIQRVVLVEHPFPGAELSHSQKCYEVTDPDRIGSRVGLVNNAPVLIQVLAKRVHETAILESFPQQSDYETLWKSTDDNSPSDEGQPPTTPHGIARVRRFAGNVKRAAESRLPESMRRWLSGRRQLREYSLKNDKFYRRW